MLTIKNLNKLVDQSNNVQKKMSEINEDIKKISVIGESGAGSVKITVNGSYICKNVYIDNSSWKEFSKKTIEDLILLAFNNAIKKVSEIQKNKMSEVSKKIDFENIFSKKNN